jgi:hypothetical protein
VPGTKYVFCDPDRESKRVYLVFEDMDEDKTEQRKIMNMLINMGYKMVSSTTPNTAE